MEKLKKDVFKLRQKKFKIILWACFLNMGMYIGMPSVYASGNYADVFQQNRIISGIVTDGETREPLIGVTIIEKGTVNGTISALDGSFQLELKSDDPVLEVSYLGFLTKTLVIGNESNLNITLMPVIESLDEIVVIGYGSQNLKDKTGALTQINADELQKGVNQDPIQSLTGRVAGVSIIKNGGDPNREFSVIVRGMAGFQAGTTPLYVVDGVPGVNPTSVSPDEIASITVLKDASAAAIYGSRAANGVIIIRTKGGNYSQKAQVNLSSYYSLDYRDKSLDLFSADELRKYANENNLTEGFSDGGFDTDWQKEIFRTGKSQNHTLAVAGGSESTKYRASYGYQDFEGVLKNTSKTKNIIRINTTTKSLNDKLTVSINSSGTFEKNSYVAGAVDNNVGYEGTGPESILFQAYTRNPTFPVYEAGNMDGGYFEVADFENSNPVALLNEITNDREAKLFLFNVKTDYEIANGLTYSLNGSYIHDDEQRWYFRPSYLKTEQEGGRGSREYIGFSQLLFEHTLNYKESFGKNNIDLLGGYTWQEERFNSFSAFGRGFLSNTVGADNLGYAGNVQPRDIASYRDKSHLISFIGRAMYNYDSKYFITATIRRDGSSKFGSNNEWGFFPSASLAWDIARENLGLPSQISQLKLRAGYGKTGNQEIGNFNSIVRYDVTGRTLDLNRINEEDNQALQMVAVNNSNPDLKWEENEEINFGLDFGLFGNRLTANVEYYIKNTSDILAWYSVPVPPNKHNFTFANVGELSNEGYEISLSGEAIYTSNFRWNTLFTFARNQQEVKSLSNDKYKMENVRAGNVSGRGLVNVWTQIVEPGRPFGTFYGWEFAGVNDKGESLYYSKDGSVTTSQIDGDRKVLGYAQPKFTAGWSNNFSMHNFDLNVSFRAVVGHKILNVTRMLLGNTTTLPNRNTLRDEALESTKQGFKDAPAYSDRYLEDGTFLRCDVVNLGYTFNTKNIDWLETCRVYVSSNNLFTVTNYTGLDPEANYQGFDGVGIDQFDVYPKTRTITFGTNITF